MDQAIYKGNEVKSKMKHSSDIPEIRTQVVVIGDPVHYQLDQGGTPKWLIDLCVCDLIVKYQGIISSNSIIVCSILCITS